MTLQIEPGDFVRSTLLRHIAGFVAAPRSLPFGKGRTIEGYSVRLADGREDFIGTDEVELIAMSEAHLARLASQAVLSDLAFEAHGDALIADPLDALLSPDAIEDYEAAQIEQARQLIVEREEFWYSDQPRRNRAVAGLALLDGHYVTAAEQLIKNAKAANLAAAAL